MANTLALGASAERLAGSSPAFRTKLSLIWAAVEKAKQPGSTSTSQLRACPERTQEFLAESRAHLQVHYAGAANRPIAMPRES